MREFILIINTPPQAQRNGKNVELGPKLSKAGGRNGFGQKVSKLIFAANEAHMESLLSYHIPNKVEVNFHMFSSSMEDRVGGEVSSTNIVTPKSWRGGQ